MAKETFFERDLTKLLQILIRSTAMLTLIILTALLPVLPNWVVNAPAAGRFTIESPIALQHDSTLIATDMGGVNYHSYHCAVEEEGANFVYLVQYYSSPSLLVYEDSVDLLKEFLDATVQQSAESISGEVLIEDDIKHRNLFPGRFWRTHYNSGHSVMKTQAFLAGDRFYLVQVAVDANHSLSPKIDRFFDTFKIIRKAID